jgi:hypothetical protein
MQICYQLIEDQKLFVQKFTGAFSIAEYMDYMKYINPYLITHDIEIVLNDFRDMYFGNDPKKMPDDFEEQISKMIDLRRKVNEEELKNKPVTVVFWVDKPLTTVIANLFTLNFPSQKYQFCTTEENVIKILKLETKLTLSFLVNNLENKFNK